MKTKLTIILGWVCGLGLTACNGETLTTNDNGNHIVEPDSLLSTEQPIINGSLDKSKAHAAVVSILGSKAGSPRYSACTATLIHPQWVLTAAHCVANYKLDKASLLREASSFEIAVGNNMAELTKATSVHEIDDIIYHPNFYMQDIVVGGKCYYTVGNDIALIKLVQPIPSTEIKPIKALPKWLGINRAKLAQGVLIDLVGFGYDNNGNLGTKYKSTKTVKNYCGAANNDSSSGCRMDPVQVTGCHPSKDYCNIQANKQYCSTGYYCLNNATTNVWLTHGSMYFEKDPSIACGGDSGGPSILKVGGEEYVAGITSYGDAVCSIIDVTTAVQDYYDWILSIAPEIANSYVEICGNGVDDDGNGKSDCADPACNAENCKIEICNNNIDDNNNGRIDCHDPVCSKDPACDFGFEISDEEDCSNGYDDNLDGDIDCLDRQCISAPVCTNPTSETAGCQAAPTQPSRLPLGMLLLGFLGASTLLRRRKAFYK